MPLKGSDPRLKNTARYGGYNKVSGAYFILVEHLLKKKRVRTVEFVPIYLAKDIEKDKKLLMEYCENTLSLVEPVILIDKMKINSLFIIDGFPAHISGRTGHSLLFKGAMQFVLSPEEAAYIKRIDKFIAYCKETKREAEPRKQDNITWEDNMAIYETFIEKLKNTKYNVMLSTQIKNLEKGKQKFAEANLKTQCEVLLEILHLFACDATGCNIKSIDGPAKAGILTLNQDITDKNITFVYQSVTGLFENRKELKNL